jgi:thymidylate kinase
MVIIIEGTNKSGKSTLAKHIIYSLITEIEFEVIKCSQPKIEDGINYAYVQYNDILQKIEDNPDKNYIIDRFHFGSYVYGPIYRGMPDFGKTLFKKLERRLLNLPYIFILAIADKKFIEEKFISEKEEYAKLELIDKEVELFKKTARMSELKIEHHNIPKKDLTKDKLLLTKIKNLCQKK